MHCFSGMLILHYVPIKKVNADALTRGAECLPPDKQAGALREAGSGTEKDLGGQRRSAASKGRKDPNIPGEFWQTAGLVK